MFLYSLLTVFCELDFTQDVPAISVFTHYNLSSPSGVGLISLPFFALHPTETRQADCCIYLGGSHPGSSDGDNGGADCGDADVALTLLPSPL